MKELDKYAKKLMHVLQETPITFLFLTIGTTSSKTLTFLLQQLNVTIYILLFKTQKVLVFLKTVSLNLLDPFLIPLLIVIVIKVSDFSNDCV